MSSTSYIFSLFLFLSLPFYSLSLSFFLFISVLFALDNRSTSLRREYANILSKKSNELNFITSILLDAPGRLRKQYTQSSQRVGCSLCSGYRTYGTSPWGSCSSNYCGVNGILQILLEHFRRRQVEKKNDCSAIFIKCMGLFLRTVLLCDSSCRARSYVEV